MANEVVEALVNQMIDMHDEGMLFREIDVYFGYDKYGDDVSYAIVMAAQGHGWACDKVALGW